MATNPTPRPFRIVCFGDSVTQAVPYCAPEDTFVAVLERRLNFRVQPDVAVTCYNAGVGGENTAEGLARMDSDVLAREPHLVTVEFGLNDIRYEPEKSLSEEQFAANLLTMHERLTAAGGQVIFMTPNPIVNVFHNYSKNTDFYQRWGGCNELCAIYAEVVREVARELSAPLCDIYAAFVRKAVEAEFFGETLSWSDLSVLSRFICAGDGVHPTAAGQELIACELYTLIVMQGLVEKGSQ